MPSPYTVTRIVPVRDDVLVLAVYAQVMVPVFVPSALEEIESQSAPAVTEAFQGMMPVPVLDTPNDVLPASVVTVWLRGEITKLSNDPDCPPRT
ncbi:MAG: hypothetical protein WCI88_16750, partial [Chloroflexota bacterium]